MIRIVSSPHPEHPLAREFEYLWLLVGGNDDSDGARACFLGPVQESDGDDVLAEALKRVDDQGDSVRNARRALDQYLKVRRLQGDSREEYEPEA